MKQLFGHDFGVAVSRSTFAALTLGRLKLFLARDEIRTLEMVDDMQPTSTHDHELGWYEIQGERIPVYGLGEELNLLGHRPPTRRIAVVVSTSEASIAILCDDIAFLDAEEISLKEIPDCMNRDRPLITKLAIHDDAVGCVTTSESLATYFLAGATP